MYEDTVIHLDKLLHCKLQSHVSCTYVLKISLNSALTGRSLAYDCIEDYN